jgi:hypothetical protein
MMASAYSRDLFDSMHLQACYFENNAILFVT